MIEWLALAVLIVALLLWLHARWWYRRAQRILTRSMEWHTAAQDYHEKASILHKQAKELTDGILRGEE